MALWDDTAGNFFHLPEIEPYGFAIFLACMGYVAARRTLDRDQQLGEIQQRTRSRAQNAALDSTSGVSRLDFISSGSQICSDTSVAGDLYDYLVADEGHVGLFIADVSGHGVPAALIASMVKMAAISQGAQAAHPALVLAGMNAALCGNTQGQFVTAAYAYLDADTRELRYSAAGHPAMLLLRRGAVTEIAENGMLLAAVEGTSYSDQTLALQPRDRLLLYTDGLIEAKNSQGELFGEAALSAAFSQSAALSPSKAIDQMVAAVQQWSKTQDDDLTVLVCDFMGEWIGASPALLLELRRAQRQRANQIFPFVAVDPIKLQHLHCLRHDEARAVVVHLPCLGREMREFHAVRDDGGLQSGAHMMLSWIDGNGEIRVAVVRANPCPIHSKFRGGVTKRVRCPCITKKVDSRLPRFWMRRRVLGIVQLHFEVCSLRSAGRCPVGIRRLRESASSTK